MFFMGCEMLGLQIEQKVQHQIIIAIVAYSLHKLAVVWGISQHSLGETWRTYWTMCKFITRLSKIILVSQILFV